MQRTPFLPGTFLVFASLLLRNSLSQVPTHLLLFAVSVYLTRPRGGKTSAKSASVAMSDPTRPAYLEQAIKASSWQGPSRNLDGYCYFFCSLIYRPCLKHFFATNLPRTLRTRKYSDSPVEHGGAYGVVPVGCDGHHHVDAGRHCHGLDRVQEPGEHAQVPVGRAGVKVLERIKHVRVVLFQKKKDGFYPLVGMCQCRTRQRRRRRGRMSRQRQG